MNSRSPLRVICFALFLAFACGDSNPLGPSADADVVTFAELVNTHREAVGCPVLAWDGDVAEVAQRHSEDMVARSFFDHTNPDGLSPFDRLAAAGILYSRAAENIAAGQPTAQAVLDAWLGSPGHRANIEDCALTHHGVGLLERHWTHLFITPP